MALNHSPEFKGVIVQTECVIEIQSESAWALANITLGTTCHAKLHASEASGSEEDLYFINQDQETLGRIHFGPEPTI